MTGYSATASDQAAWDRALRPKLCKLACHTTLARAVSAKLRRKWSPEQVEGWLKRAFPGEACKQVSHETIYRSLYIQARGVLKKELLAHLRAKRTVRRSKHASQKRNGNGQIKDAVSISERPASVEDQAVPGHHCRQGMHSMPERGEGDLIGGSKNSYIATLVERHSRYVMLVKVANKDTESVVTALIKSARKLPRELYKSLTWDRGKELADHPRFTLATDVDVYFCDPQSPWQRGSNENTNRLLRQYLPRGTDLSVHSQAKLSAIARQLNERPRKTLQYHTPAEKFAECVASIG
jgi:IS30 family transposase